MAKFHDVAAELALILDKIGADTSFPPTQETMRNIYGSSGPDLSHASVVPHTKPSEDFQTKEYNVRNETANICCLLCTCGIAGCETYTLTLEPEQAVFRYSNRCDASVERKPYAQLGSVDENVCCCCIHTVNGLAPGCCGDPTAVKEIAEELQNRKVGRGNIAQLRNQENTMIKAMEAEPWLEDVVCECLLLCEAAPRESGRETLHLGRAHGHFLAQERHRVPPVTADAPGCLWPCRANTTSGWHAR